MNILYISKLDGYKWQGPNQSVPSQISAQSKYDNVFWYNINDVKKDEWLKKIECYNIKDYKDLTIKSLPKPFNKPDLVIFQGVYKYPFCKLIYEIWEMNIPYLVIPRCSLTVKAQHKKKLKKIIGNLVFFRKFLRKAAAIQYLTEKEYKDSGDKWNRNILVIPNGIDDKHKTKIFNNNKKQITGVYIGRIDIYHKGLDLLIDACTKIKDELIYNNCVIKLYGPDRYNSRSKLEKKINKQGVQKIISLHDGVFDDEKEDILLNSDFFIMTSRFEGHPMGLIEALSYGLPCLATEGTNMTNEISTADAGWTCETNEESIANALRTLIRQRELLHIKGKNAHVLSKKYTWDKIAEKSHNMYVDLLKQSNN